MNFFHNQCHCIKEEKKNKKLKCVDLVASHMSKRKVVQNTGKIKYSKYFLKYTKTKIAEYYSVNQS